MRHRPPTFGLRAAFFVAFLASLAAGQSERDEQTTTAWGTESGIPSLTPSPESSGLDNQPVTSILVREEGSQVDRPFYLVGLGQAFSSGLARRAMQELLSSGKYARIHAEASLTDTGVQLRLHALPRFILGEVELSNGELESQQVLAAAELTLGNELTLPELPAIEDRVEELYRRRGYPQVDAKAIVPKPTPGAKVTLQLRLTPGPRRTLAGRHFHLPKAAPPKLKELVRSYASGPGDAADEEQLQLADKELTRLLRQRGWHRAVVTHELTPERRANTRARLWVRVNSGPLVRIHFEGYRAFGAASLEKALRLEEDIEKSPEAFVNRLKSFYRLRGFFDAEVHPQTLTGPDLEELYLHVQEGTRLKVAGRDYPCLDGPRSAEEISDELNAFLDEQLPGGDELFRPVNSNLLNQHTNPGSLSSGNRALELTPETTYSPEVYTKALTHLRNLLRSEGHLSAKVGPLVALRRRCDVLSPPGRCIPVGQRQSPPVRCPTSFSPIPGEDPPPPETTTCIPDPVTGRRCESKVVLSIPIKRGPKTYLWDARFEGNTKIVDRALADAAELELGAPVSQIKLQKARRRILDRYQDQGFAFATVDVDLELSEDHSRGRARFVIGEREPVRIRGFVVRGAEHTSHGLILNQLELQQGGLFRRALVRSSEQQLAQLGVFASVSVGLEDPAVPAKEKLVVVQVEEMATQYVDVRPGVSTGEGVRARLEYGHRNITGRAIQGRLRLQVGYLPDFLIFEDEVRRRFGQLSVADRLERRNSLTIEFPLGGRYRLALDGIDVRDNSRDFGITKRAGIITVTHRPSKQLSLQTGSSFELNDARVFAETQTLQAYLEENPQLVRLLNVPEGRSFAVALRAGASWDRTDNPLGATRGTLLTAEVEPVIAYLGDDNAAVELENCETEGTPCEFASRFIRVSQRVAGYIPLNDNGLSLALSLRWGANFQLLDNSSTYPDRLFFFGGGDSLRGFLQASVIPQDVADRLSRTGNTGGPRQLQAQDVVIRGGDFVINPRAELRIPLTSLFHTAVFVDSGNVWRDIDNVDPTQLRYTAGTGLRAITPIGPLAFDYGFKLDRRYYEDSIGAFHFSVGLF